MKIVLAMFIVLSFAGCAATQEDETQNPVSKNDAVEDFIKVAELEEQDAIRTLDQLDDEIITERYIIVSDKRRSYLIAYRRPCRELTQNKITADIRHDRNIMRAKFDTFRGCRIGEIYALTEGQVTELLNLGGALGEG